MRTSGSTPTDRIFRKRATCRACGGGLAEFLSFPAMPIAGTYLSEEELGREPLIPLTVTACRACGLVQLREVIGEEVYRTYRFSGSVMSGYRAYLDSLAEDLAARGVKGRRVVEVGASDGYLLGQIAARGSNRVFGYEPSLALGERRGKGPTISASFFSRETLAECPLLPADALVIRHTLEHIDDPGAFLSAAREALRPDGLLVLEVPDLDAILERGLFLHFYHEHLSYFSRDSLSAILRDHGFSVTECRKVDIHGGSLLLFARRAADDPAAGSEGTAKEARKDARLGRFAEEAGIYFKEAAEFIASERGRGLRIAGYGAAHRTASLCTIARWGPSTIEYLVDRNESLHGLYIPGMHIPVHGVGKLASAPPDALILFASSHENEIIGEQRPFLESGGRMISLFPSPHYLAAGAGTNR